MKKTFFTRTLLISGLASALLSFTACKSDEDKCKEGDLAACQRAIDKATNDMKSALESMKSAKTPNSALVSPKMLGRLRSVELSPKELSGYSAAELRILRNAIFASHGYIFKSDDLKEYFAQFDWYNPAYKDVTARLSPIEKKNIATIKAMEDDDGEGFRDMRDGKTYRYVKIGKQTWMAENLDYETQNSYCYKDKPANCKKYGRLYTWNAALKACPAGWHLPSKGAFETLVKTVGNDAAKKLRSTKGWNKVEMCDRFDEGECIRSHMVPSNGSDAFGFSLLPAGTRMLVVYSPNGNPYIYEKQGDEGYLWSSTKSDKDNAFYMHFLYNIENAYLINDLTKGIGFSVRCIQD